MTVTGFFCGDGGRRGARGSTSASDEGGIVAVEWLRSRNMSADGNAVGAAGSEACQGYSGARSERRTPVRLL